MVTALSPIGLPVITTVQRDALTGSSGFVIWNSDTSEAQHYRNGGWEAIAIAPEVNDLIGALALDIARLRTAVRFLGIEPDLFEPT